MSKNKSEKARHTQLGSALAGALSGNRDSANRSNITLPKASELGAMLAAALPGDRARAKQLTERILERASWHSDKPGGWFDDHDTLHALRDAHVPAEWVLPVVVSTIEREDQVARERNIRRDDSPPMGLLAIKSSDSVYTLISSFAKDALPYVDRLATLLADGYLNQARVVAAMALGGLRTHLVASPSLEQAILRAQRVEWRLYGTCVVLAGALGTKPLLDWLAPIAVDSSGDNNCRLYAIEGLLRNGRNEEFPVEYCLDLFEPSTKINPSSYETERSERVLLLAGDSTVEATLSRIAAPRELSKATRLANLLADLARTTVKPANFPKREECKAVLRRQCGTFFTLMETSDVEVAKVLAKAVRRFAEPEDLRDAIVTKRGAMLLYGANILAHMLTRIPKSTSEFLWELVGHGDAQVRELVSHSFACVRPVSLAEGRLPDGGAEMLELLLDDCEPIVRVNAALALLTHAECTADAFIAFGKSVAAAAMSDPAALYWTLNPRLRFAPPDSPILPSARQSFDSGAAPHTTANPDEVIRALHISRVNPTTSAGAVS